MELFLLRSTSRRAKKHKQTRRPYQEKHKHSLQKKKKSLNSPRNQQSRKRGLGSAAYQGQSRLKIVLEEGLDGGYKCQLSVKYKAFCQLSVKWLLIINYEAYMYVFDAKFSFEGTYNVN